MRPSVESVYPRKKEVPKNFLQTIVGDTERRVESKRVEQVVASGDVEHDLRRALQVRSHTAHAPLLLTLLTLEQARSTSDGPSVHAFDDRSFDLVNITNWDEKIVWEPDEEAPESFLLPETDLSTPLNKTLESGLWTQSIIWGAREPFRDFTQLELHEQDMVQEERQPGMSSQSFLANKPSPACAVQEVVRPRKRMRTDTQPKDKFNISNDQFYEVSKEGGRHRVRQTFGQLVVEHAYPAQKLQLPFVRVHPFEFMHSIGSSNCIVQDPLVQTGGSLIPPPCAPIPTECRAPLQQGADSEEEKRQGRSQGRQGWRYWRGSAPDRRSELARHEQLHPMGVL